MSWMAGAAVPAVKTTYGRKKTHNPATSTMFLSVQAKTTINRPPALNTIEEGDENPFSSSSSSSSFEANSEIASTPLRDRSKNSSNIFSPPSSESSTTSKKGYSKRKICSSSSVKTDRKAVRHHVESSPVSSCGLRKSSREEHSFDEEAISKSSSVQRYRIHLYMCAY